MSNKSKKLERLAKKKLEVAAARLAEVKKLNEVHDAWCATLSPHRKEEHLGAMYFDRHGEEDWQGGNSFYTDDCHIVTGSSE
jgi:hypothetical protein